MRISKQPIRGLYAEIARQLQLSYKTVRLAIEGHPYHTVSDETRHKVLAMVEPVIIELSHRPKVRRKETKRQRAKREYAEKVAKYETGKMLAIQLRQQGKKIAAIMDALNRAGHKTICGKQFQYRNLRYILKDC